MSQALNTISEIKAAVDAGQKVFCDGGGYEVIKDSVGQYLIHFLGGDGKYYIGLHGLEGTEYAEVLNGKDFYAETTPDFAILNAGSIFILTAITEAADAWVEEKVGINDETQYWGQKGIVVEHRYIDDIIAGIRESELTLEIGV